MDASVIIPYKGQHGDDLNKTLNSLCTAKNNNDYEIIIVSDYKKEESPHAIEIDKAITLNIKIITGEDLSVARQRNLGASIARGNYLFFADPYLAYGDYWLDELIDGLNKSDSQCITPAIEDIESGTIGYGGTFDSSLNFLWLPRPETSMEEVPLAVGYGILTKKDFYWNIGGFNESFLRYGVEDYELSLRLWFFGYKVVVCRDVVLKHYPISGNPYRVSHFEIIYNYLTLGYLIFEEERFSKLLELLRERTKFDTAASFLMEGDKLIEGRKKNISQKVLSDSFFLEKFMIPF